MHYHKTTLFFSIVLLTGFHGNIFANNGMLEFSKIAAQQYSKAIKPITTPVLPFSSLYKSFEKKTISNLSLSRVEIIEDNYTINNSKLREQDKSLSSEIMQLQNTKNAKKTLPPPNEIYQNPLIRSDGEIKPYQKLPSLSKQNFMEGTDIVFNNHLIL